MTDVYLGTVERLEPSIHPIDEGGGWASVAISLKRIADSLELLSALAKAILPEVVKDPDCPPAVRIALEKLL